MNQLKKIIIAVSVLLCLGVQSIYAQTMYVNLKNGSQTSYDTENIRKLNFSGEKIVIEKPAAISDTLALLDLRSLSFTDFPEVIEPGVLTKDGFFTLGEDTTIKLIVNDYRGNLQWQKTLDNTNWINITGQTSDTLSIKLDTEAMYRAMITEGDCLPVYSDSAVVVTNTEINTSSIEPDKLGLTLISDSTAILNGEYIYTGTQGADLEVGKVIIDELSGGTIRKITELRESGDTVFAKTDQATMEDLFYDTSFKLSSEMIFPTQNLKSASATEIEKALTDEDGFIHPVEINYFSKEGDLLKSVSVFSEKDEKESGVLYMHENWTGLEFFNYENSFTVPDITGEDVTYTGNAKCYISDGYFTFDPEFKFEFDFTLPKVEWDWGNTRVKKGQLKKFKFYTEEALIDFKNVLAFEANVELEYAKDWTLKKNIIVVKSKFMIGAVPVWIDYEVDINCALKATLDIDVKKEYGFQNKNHLTLGAVYENKKWSLIKDLKNDNEVIVKETESGKAEIRFDLYPTLDIKIYSVAGPSINVGPYLNFELDASGTKNWDASINLGVEAALSTSSEILGNEVEPFDVGSWSFFNTKLWQTPVKINAISGNYQTAETDEFLTDSIVVEVKDSRDNPVRFAQVHFLPSAGGKAAPEAVLTNDQGLAKTAWKVANEPGNNVLKAYLMDGNDEEIAGAAILFNATGEGEEKSDTLVYGGKTYKTVKIGEQWWMAENLAYNTSTSISLPPYGNYYTLTDALSVCPSGWHLPSDSDWEQLAKYISDKNGPYQKDEYKWLGVGTHLKSNSGWLAWPPNGTYYGNGTDDYNFNGLPGGSYFLEQDEEDNLFYENSFKGENATWWTSTSFSFSDGDDHFSGYWARGLDAFYFPDPTNPFSLIKDSSLYKIGIEHIFGNFMKLNVRCVKDNE